MSNGDQKKKEAGGGNKWAVMGGIALNIEYTRKYSFDATAAAKVTAKLVAVPPPSAFLEAVQTSAMGGMKRRPLEALPGTTPELPHKSSPPWLLPEDREDNGQDQDPSMEDEFPALEFDDDEPAFVMQIPEKANKRYTFHDGLAGSPMEGTVDSEGWLVQPVTPGATTGSLHFEDDPDPIPIQFVNSGEP